MSRTETSVVDQIEAIVRDVPGWTPVDQLLVLFNIASATSHLEGDIVEIGCWCGRATVVLGRAARLARHTRVHSVDLFPARDDWKQNSDGSYSFETVVNGVIHKGYQDQTVWREPFEKDIASLYEKHDGIIEVFEKTISRYGLTDVVTAYRGDSSLLVSRCGNVRCRVAFIDGDHSYSAVRHDILNVERLLVAGGWLCFDDAFTCYDGVDRAIRELIVESRGYSQQHQVTRKLYVACRSGVKISPSSQA